MVETEAEETKKCPTCGREIPVSKFRIHEIQCARHNYICKVTGKCVAKADREEHEEELEKLKLEKEKAEQQKVIDEQ